MATAAALERRRREMAAAYVKATRRHAPRAGLGKKLVRATCDALQAEIRDARAAAKAAKAAGTPDLFRPAPEQDGGTPAAADHASQRRAA